VTVRQLDHSTLESLTARLGREVLRAVLLPEPAVPVTGIRVHDPGQAAGPARGEIVLGIGVHDTAAMVELLRQLGPVAAALAVKCRIQDDTEVLRAAAEHRLGVLILADGIDWLEGMALIQGELAQAAAGPGPDGPDPAPAATNDLFYLADLAAGAVGGPVTVEDQWGWLLAYSRDQAGGDQVRVDTLMNRRSPAGFTRSLQLSGATRRISRSDGPVQVRGDGAGVADRLVIHLRVGGFQVGSMWAVVTEPGEAQIAAFEQIAQRAAMHLMRRRTEEHRSHQVEMEQLAVLLHGSPAITGTSDAIDLPDGSHWVAALALAPRDPTERAIARSRLEQGLALNRRVPGLTAHAGQLSNLTYVILTLAQPHPDPVELVHSWLRELLGAGGHDRLPVHVGVGRAASGLGELPRSRREAELALAVARADPDPAEPLGFEDCWARSALMRVLDESTMAELESVTPLRTLLEQDRLHGTDYIDTLHAWLRHHGNIRDAAQQLHIHANTLRYRLGKLAQSADIDLDDPDTRLVLALQLRAMRNAPQPAR
jgi:PucR C-terminal helix-turn-helix domain/GGDEF-like domain